MSGNYPETLAIRTNHKLRHYVEEAEISKRDLLKLGAEVYYSRNPELKIKAKKKWLKKSLVELQENELSTKDKMESLEKELFDLTLGTVKINDFFNENKISDREEFLKSVFEIKKLITEDTGFSDVPDSDFGIQSLCCRMDTEEFKESCFRFLNLYAEVKS